MPEGWKRVRLQDACDKKICYGIVQAGPHIPGGVPYIKCSDLNDLSSVDRLGRTSNLIHEKYIRTSVVSGDLVLSLRGNIGDVAIVPDALNGANLTRGTALLSFGDDVDNLYAYYAIESDEVKNKMSVKSQGSTFKEISIKSLRLIKILLPPLAEQKKIAEILSTWDDAIQTTEKLIECSRLQKKALMQHFFGLSTTPSSKLSGTIFVKLGTIANISTGKSNRADCNPNGLYMFFDRSEDLMFSDDYLYDSEVVIVPGEGQDFSPKYFCGKFGLHQRTYAVMPSSDVIFGKYLYYYILKFKNYFLSKAVGSTVKSLRLPMFKNMPIMLPSLDEQKAIAEVLNDADREIELYEQKLEALKLEKKALMQQLLTGKRRVIVDESVSEGDPSDSYKVKDEEAAQAQLTLSLD